MDYTKNYHLPQWAKEDRIIMEDFNDAMASLETGLGRAEKKADAAAQTAGAAVTPESLREGLFRLAYNRCAALTEQSSAPWQLGLVRRRFDQTSGNTPEGTLQQTDCVWTANGDGALSWENLSGSFRTESNVSYAQDNKRFAATFTPPYSGWLTSLNASVSITNGGTGDTGGCTVRLTDLASNETIERRSSFQFPNIVSTSYRQVKMNFFLTGKHTYRLEVILDSLASKPRLDFFSGSETVSVAGCQTPEVTAGCSLPLESSAQGGLALVRYRSEGPAVSMRLDWGGKRLTPHRLRTVTLQNGQQFQEAEFRRAGPLSGGELTLTAACPKGSSLSLYAISAIAI